MCNLVGTEKERVRSCTINRCGIFIEQTMRPGSIRSTLRPLRTKGSKKIEGNLSTSDAISPPFSDSKNFFTHSKSIVSLRSALCLTTTL
ncbi:uncharacterized protein G2W53_008945 [Senna tora]|uniref:Uncharacterized protein n=1 Tax=Senna tora TaxID=362788 RepID=A0A835C731_9FABA|nr:uncharacterized protein G2W53_008945 [Senna tora]